MVGLDTFLPQIKDHKSAYYETGNKQQQGHHEQESKPKADREKQEGRSQCSP